MNKTLRFFYCAMVCLMTMPAMAAISIKKAAPVATQSTSMTDNTASLVGTVLGLVSSVQDLNKQQKALTAECIPSSQEITFVDNTVKEWAKTGATTADEIERTLRRSRCNVPSGYEAAVQVAAGTDGTKICYNYWSGEGNTGMVWENFPKVGKATYCTDGSLSCSDKNKKTVSDIYDIFNLVDFSEADYTPSEATMAAKLIAKIEKCSNAKLSAKKKAMWGEFLVDTIGNVGQKTNTGAIMESVGGLTGGGGLSSLGAIATQFMDR